jgi:5-methylthioribose kinase
MQPGLSFGRMVLSNDYKPLSPETLGQRLGGLDVMKQSVGADEGAWTVREVGDGNLNLVFIVEGDAGSVIVKQALPYVRLVGDSWPLPLKRAFFEYHALIRQEARDPGSVPKVLHFDEGQALIIMERLHPHIILRQQTMEGRKVAGLGRTLGLFAARTAFRGSDLSMTAGDKKADAALFAGNVELCDITETLVFTDPYYDAEMNRHTTPQLDGIVADLRRDEALKVEVQHMKRAFTSRSSTSAGCRTNSVWSNWTLGEFATAIRDMWVRGAPLIGATAAYGMALAMQRDPSDAALDAAWEHAARNPADRNQPALGAR